MTASYNSARGRTKSDASPPDAESVEVGGTSSDKSAAPGEASTDQTDVSDGGHEAPERGAPDSDAAEAGAGPDPEAPATETGAASEAAPEPDDTDDEAGQQDEDLQQDEAGQQGEAGQQDEDPQFSPENEPKVEEPEAAPAASEEVTSAPEAEPTEVANVPERRAADGESDTRHEEAEPSQAAEDTDGEPTRAAEHVDATGEAHDAVERDEAAPTVDDGPADAAPELEREAPSSVGEPVAGAVPPSEPPAPTTEQARRRLMRILDGGGMPWGQVIAALLLALLGTALVAQVRSAEEAGLRQLRESELVAILDDVSNRVDALQAEVVQLEADKERLQGQQGSEEAARAAQERLDSYAILAGTVPVEGPGISVLVNDPDGTITQTILLDAIQELRDAGAEAIQIGPHRVVASTYVGTDVDGVVTLNGSTLTSPFRILAIGDAHTLAGAMAIPGGFTDNLRSGGATVDVEEHESQVIDALHEPSDPRYAQPVETAPSP